MSHNPSAPIRQRLFHDAHLALFFLIFFIGIALPIKWYLIILWAASFALLAYLLKVSLTFILQSLSWALLLSLSVWLINFFFHSKQISSDEIIIRATHTTLKIGVITWVALLSSRMIHLRDIVMLTLQKKWLHLPIGYACLCGLGSLSLLQAESKRITLNAKLRGIKWHQRILVWIPLLIFSLRHAQRGAMSLRARGLYENKSFYYNYQATMAQTRRFIFFITLWFIFITLTAYFLKN